MKIALLALIVLVLLAAAQRLFFSFDAQVPGDYAETGPTLDIRQALSGEMVSEGVVYGPTGRVVSRFVARMIGEWEGSSGTLAEHFTYSDGGGTLDRRWTLSFGKGGAFTATAPDIIGTGHGQQMGSTVRMTYRIRLADEAGGHVLDVVDWMYLMENGTIINRSEMRKFGLLVGELIATIRSAS